MTLHASEIVEVVGESYRQEALARVASGCTDRSPYLGELTGYARARAKEDEDGRWFRALLLREPDNPVDRDAVAVFADGVGHIGYLSSEDAVEYGPVFDALGRRGRTVGACPAILIGGGPGKPNYGALLCLSAPQRVIQDLDSP
jgi:hypothetical protein